MHFLTLTVAALAAVVSAAPPNVRRYVDYELHERRADTGTWAKRGRVHPDVKLPMRIGLTQSNVDNVEDMLMDVSHPDSPNYGNHMTEQQVIEKFAPSKEAVESVRTWLHSAGIATHRISISPNRQWIQFDARTSEAEDLFNTAYHFYEHKRSGAATIASDELVFPVEAMAPHITVSLTCSHLKGIKTFASEIRSTPAGEIEKRTAKERRAFHRRPPLLKALPKTIGQLKALGLLATCQVAITPDCIRALYNISEATTATPGNELGIFEDLGDYYDQADLDEFFLTLYPRIPTGTHPVGDLIDGAVAPTNVLNAGPESLLDFQISYPLIYPQNSVLYQTDDPVYEANYTFNGFLNNFFDAIDGSYCTFSAYNETGNSPLDPPYPDPSNAAGAYKGSLQCGKYKPTNVISISYGGSEADLPISYQRRQCLEIAKLGMRGISVLVSSGDSGVAGPAGDPGPNGCLGADQNIFAPDFPASCPYITALGATYLPPGGNVYKDEEVAVTRFPSGGGFSNIYKRPSYQTTAVRNYLTKYNPPYPYYESVDNSSFGANGGIYNRAGRAYPDFAAIGDNVVVVVMGMPTLIGGTSASSPCFASILTRINQQRLIAGKSTIGFVNPVLYANPSVLHDITTGSNPGCNTNGFSCAPGWDPVTGYGTPNYPAMLKLFMGLK